jgi:ribosomal protein S18 acetylase RimI-like enzyme
VLHVFVDVPFRRHGAARAMLESLEAWAAATGARHLWLETQDTNCAAIAAYERLGLSIVGFDFSLYENPPAAETGVFLARAVEAPRPVPLHH